MKKLILGAVAIAAMSNYSFGQGELTIANSSTASTKIFLSGTAGGQSTGQSGSQLPGSGTTGYTFELFYNTTVNPSTAAPNVSSSATPWAGGGWVDGTVTANNTTLTGRIAENDGGAGFVTLPNSASSAVGVQANLEMIGWNTAVGGATLATFIQAYNNNAEGLVYGYSAVANILLGNNASPGNSSFFSVPNGGVSGFTLAPLTVVSTPEPTSMVLAGVGALSLLALRRKK